jgi:hypothetical protein
MKATDPSGHRGRSAAERPTGRNFTLGLLAGSVASGIGWGAIYELAQPDVYTVVLILLLVGKVGLAVATAGPDRLVGFAPGLLVSLGVGMLIAGGLCWNAVEHAHI